MPAGEVDPHADIIPHGNEERLNGTQRRRVAAECSGDQPDPVPAYGRGMIFQRLVTVITGLSSTM